MKKIIIPLESKTQILASNLPENPIIGASSKGHPDRKSFLVMTKFRKEDSYYMMCREGFGMGNGYATDGVGPYAGTLSNVLSHPSLDFVLFDSTQELFKWLAE
jgi:hypothetical protein